MQFLFWWEIGWSNIFQNLTGGRIFCPKTQTPSLWGWESAEFEKVSFAKISQSFWSYSPFTLAHAYHFVWERMKKAKDRAFQGQFFGQFFPQWLLFFFSNIILFVSVNPSGWETLKLAIGFVGKTKKTYTLLSYKLVKIFYNISSLHVFML